MLVKILIMMIKYYDRQPCKQYIRFKPIHGYKVWCMNACFGYLINFVIYQGSFTNKTDHFKSIWSLLRPLLRMLDELSNKTYRHNVYFDNLFTSFPLLLHLRDNMGFGGTGTLNANRFPKSCPIQDKKQFQKTTRGFSE